MAKAPRLSVYVTPAGFYDVVVAAPNQKAALAAWGVRANLFAEGAARPEDDAAWRAKALAKPGEVIRKPRGDRAKIMAQPAPKPRATPSASPASQSKPTRRTVRPPPSPPADRAALTAAEAALSAAHKAAERSAAELDNRRRTLEDEAAELQGRWDEQKASLEAAVGRARRAFVADGGAL